MARASSSRKTPEVEEAETVSGPEKVVQAITRGIILRRFGPGYRLIESELAASLDVSRGSVREAFKKLAAQGVVRINPNRGASIRPLSREEAKQLVLVLEVLCGLAARLAALHITLPTARERFASAASALMSTPISARPEEFLARRSHYYAVMLEVAKNPDLTRLMPVSQIHLLRSQFHAFLSTQDLSAMLKEYAGISEAILQGKQRTAEARMRRHMRQTLDRFDDMDESAFIKPL